MNNLRLAGGCVVMVFACVSMMLAWVLSWPSKFMAHLGETFRDLAGVVKGGAV